MKSLVVLPWFPWPAGLGGGPIRSEHVVRALAGCGEVDLFAMVRPDRLGDAQVPDGAPVSRLCAVARPPARVGGVRRIAWLAGNRPRALTGRDYREMRAAFQQWARPDYDLIWCYRIDSWVAIEGLIAAPAVVVDFDDLEDVNLHRRAAVGGNGVRARVRARVDRLDGDRWTRFQRATARAVSAAVTSSEDERAHLGAAHGAVVPNGYPPPVVPLGRPAIGSPPVVLFQGNLTRAPNADAAQFLAVDVWPKLQSLVNGVHLRLVGNTTADLHLLQRPPDIVMTGQVPTMAPELARADVIAIPLRSGGGTPVKVLEAFAHRIPVVTTSFVAASLELEDGREVLVRDDAAGFAEACASLLVAGPRRESLVDAAHARYLERHESSAVERVIVDIATEAVAMASRRKPEVGLPPAAPLNGGGE